MNQSKKFVLVPTSPRSSFTEPSIQVSDNQLLTIYFHGDLNEKCPW